VLPAVTQRFHDVHVKQGCVAPVRPPFLNHAQQADDDA
jgi:hypothetical protein